MNKKSFQLGVTKLRLLLLMALVGLVFVVPTVQQVQAQAGNSNPNPNVQPVVTLNGLGPVFIGDQFTFSAHITNTGSEPGYGPFVDLLLPQGITLDTVNYLGESLSSLGGTIIEHDFTASDPAHPTDPLLRCIDHPIARFHNPVSPYTVCGAVGETYVTLIVPFGSFVQDQYVELDITATLADDVPLSSPLEIYARGGFRFGDDPADNPCCDHVIFEGGPSPIEVSWGGVDGTVEPRLVRVQKDLDADEGEIASGPNNPASYTITVEVASGQTLSNFLVKELLPTNIVVTGISSSSPITVSPTGISPATPFVPTSADNEVDVTFTNTIVGAGEGTTVASFTVDFYVPFTDEGGEILTGGAQWGWDTITNNLLAEGRWDQSATPNNTMTFYESGVCPTNCDPANEGTAKPVAIQKSSSVNTPYMQVGSIITYTLNFQVSDYFALDNLVITDVLGDGLEYLPNTSSYNITWHGNTVNGAFVDGANASITPNPGNGETTIVYDVSGQLIDQHGQSGYMLGGCIEAGGGLRTDLDACGNGGAHGTITLQAVVKQQYSSNYNGNNANIDQGDFVENNVEIEADVLNRSDLSPDAPARPDTSGVTNAIPYGILSKDIVAVNGSAPTPVLYPGDVVTYRLTYTLPTDSFEKLVLTDYLPLPAFDVSTFDVVNDWRFVSGLHNATFTPQVGVLPVVTTNTQTNSVEFDFGSYPNPVNTPRQIVIDFDVPVRFRVTADELFLTNQAAVSEGATRGSGQNIASSIKHIILRNAALVITKEISDVPTVRTPMESVIEDGQVKEVVGPQAGDEIEFTVKIINEGGQAAYNLIVNDTFDPLLYEYVPGSLTITLDQGGGTTIPVTIESADGLSGAVETDFFTVAGVRLVDPAHGNGLCQPFDDTTGAGEILITYRLRIRDDVPAGTEIPNTASIINYNNTETGGEDFVDPNDPVEDSTTVITAEPIVVAKGIVSTSEAHTSNSTTFLTTPNIPAVTTLHDGANVTIGEVVKYRIVTHLPAGLYPELWILDQLPAHVTYNVGTAGYYWVVPGGVTLAGGLLDTNATNPASLASYSAGNIDISGNDLRFNISETAGTPLAVDNTALNDDGAYLVIEFDAVINNVTQNVIGVSRTNTAKAYPVENDPSDPVAPREVTVVIQEPDLSLTKAHDTLQIDLDAGAQYTYILDIDAANATNNTTAFDLRIVDVLDTFLTTSTGNIRVLDSVGAVIPSANVVINNLTSPARQEIVITLPELDKGESFSVEIDVTVNNNVPAGYDIDNEAVLTWTSVPGERGTGNATPGNPGTPTGERTGETPTPNTYRDADDVTFTTDDLELEKTILATSEISTGQSTAGVTQVTIGEIVRYQLVIDVPEGQSYNVFVDDQLSWTAADGLLLEPIFDGEMLIYTISDAGGVVSADLAGLNTATAASPLRYGINFDDTNIVNWTAGTGLLRFDFGTLTNSDADVNVEQIVIQFNALVLNESANTFGDILANEGSVSATETTDPASPRSERHTDVVNVQIVEPLVEVTKDADVQTAQAGEEIEFTIVLTNTGTDGGTRDAIAFDLSFIDGLNAKYENVNIVSTTPSNATVVGAASVYNNAAHATDPHTILITADALPIGESITVVYTVDVVQAVSPSEPIENTVEGTWESLPNGGTPGNPTGSDTPGNPGDPDGGRDGSGGHNNYEDDATETVTITAVEPTKTIIDTTIANTTTAADGLSADVAIGEIVTYELAVSIPRSVSTDFVIIDTLDVGLRFIPDENATVEIVTGAGSLTLHDWPTIQLNTETALYDTLGADIFPGFITRGVAGANETLTFDLGDITNYITGAGGEQIVLRYNVFVENIAGNTAGSTTAPVTPATELENGFIVTIGGNLRGTSNSTVVTVNEPDLDVDKESSVVAPATVQAGDMITYTVTVTNNGDAHAYHIVLTDVLPANVTLNLASVTSSIGTATPSGTGDQIVVNGIASLAPGDDFTLTYSVVVDETVELTETIDNVATVTGNSLPDTHDQTENRDETDPTNSDRYEDDDTETVVVGGDFDLVKVIYGTNNTDSSDPAAPTFANDPLAGNSNTAGNPRPVVFGERVTFRLVTEVPHATLPNIRLVDQLIPNLVYVPGSVRIARVGDLSFADITGVVPAITDSLTVGGLALDDATYVNLDPVTGEIVITVGDVVWTGTNPAQRAFVVVEFEADVIHTTTYPAIFANNYELIYEDATGTDESPNPSNTVYLEPIDPDLDVVKTLVTTPATVTGDDVVTYTIDIENEGTSPAYNIAITEALLPAWLEYDAPAFTSTDANWSLGAVVAGRQTFVYSGSLAVNGTTSLTVNLVVNRDAQIGDTFSNSIEVDYTSKADPLTGRTYEETPPPTNPVTVVGAFELDKVIFATDNPLTGGDPDPVPAFDVDPSTNPRPVSIGETVTFRLVTQIPALTVEGVVIADTLIPGLEYVANSTRIATIGNVAFDPVLSVTPTSLTTWNGGLTTPFTDASLTFATFPAGSGNIVFDFGDVTNNTPDPATPTYIIIEFEALVTEDGIGIDNIVENEYTLAHDDDGGTPEESNEVAIRIDEPELDVEKTLLTSDVVKGGDSVQYEVIIENTGDAPAYNIVVTELALPAWLEYVAAPGTITTTDAWTVGPIASPQTFVYTGVLEVGDSVSFTINLNVRTNAQIGDAFTNSINVAYTPASDPTQGTPYNEGPVPSDPIEVSDGFELDKVIYRTDNAETADPVGAPGFDLDASGSERPVVVGETVTFRLVTQLPVLTVRDLNVNDTLIPGLDYVPDSIRIATIGNILFSDIATPLSNEFEALTTWNGALTGVTPFADATIVHTAADGFVEIPTGSGDIIFHLGEVTNNNVDPSDPAYVIIEFDAIVTVDSLRPVFITDILENFYEIDYVNTGGVHITTVPPSNTVHMQIVQPDLMVVKSANVTQAGAGDTITYTIVVTNIGDATAHNIVITDTLPTNVTYDLADPAPTGVTRTGTAATPIFTLNNPLTHDTTGGANVFTFSFDVTVDQTVVLGDTLTNTIPTTNVTYTPEDPTIPYNPDNPTTVDVDVVGGFDLEKTIFNTTNSYTETATNRLSADLAIGETVTFRLVTRIPAAALDNVAFVDTLVNGLEYVDGTGRIGVIVDTANAGKVTFDPLFGAVDELNVADITAPSGSVIDAFTLGAFPEATFLTQTPVGGGATEVRFNVGDVVNAGPGTAIIVLEFDALVTNSAVNQNGRTPFVNNYVVEYDGTTTPPSNDVTMTIVEPELEITKAPVAGSVFSNGGVVTYRIEVEHATTSTSTAHDIVVVDTLPEHLTFNAGTATLTASNPAITLQATNDLGLDPVSNRQAIQFVINGSLATTDTFEIEFETTISGAVQPGTNLVNDVYTTWTGDPDDTNPERRDGSETPVENDHRDDNSSSNPVVALQDISKRIGEQDEASYLAGEDHPVTIGDIVTYQLAFLVEKGNTPYIEITDQLVAGIQFVPGSLVINPDPALSYDNQANVGLITDLPDASNSFTLTVRFDNVVNSSTTGATREYIVITFEVLVVDEAVNTAGAIWANEFDLETPSGITPSNPVTIVVTEPELAIQKTVVTTPGDIVNGSVVTYGIRIENTGDAIAYDVAISDDLDPRLTYVGNVTGAAPTVTQSGQVLTFELAQIAVGGVVEFTFDVQISGAVQHGSTVDNTAVVTWTSQDGNDPNERDGSDPNDPTSYIDDSTVPFTVRELADVEKRIGEQTEADYLAGNTHPVTIGDVITYQLAFLVDKGNTTSIVIEDQLVAGIEFVPGSLVINAGTVTSDVPVIDEPSVGNGNKLTVTFNNVNNPSVDASSREHIVITFEVVVLNDIVNSTGYIWANDFDVTTPSGTTTSNEVRAEVVEPILTITKTVDATVPVTGTTLTYRIRVEHTGNSGADAHDIVVTDVLPSDLTYVANSVIAVQGNLPIVDDSALPTLTFTIDELLLGNAVEFTFDATVTAVLQTGDTITNNADMNWTTQPGNDPNERNGSGDPNDPNDPDDYRDDDEIIVTIGDPGIIEKRIAGYTQAEADAGVPVIMGDVVTYELAVLVGKGTTAQLELVDIFVPGIEYDPASIAVTTVGTAAVNIGGENIDYDAATRALTVTLTNVQNTSTATTWDEYVVVTFDVVVVDDDAVNSVGDIWVNTFDLSVDGGTPKTSNPVRVEVVPVLADLTIVKSHVESRFIVGNPDPYIYTIVVSNSGGRAVDTAPVIVKDDIPAPYLEAVSASGTDWACTVTGNSVECEYTGSYPINPGTSLEPIEVAVLAKSLGVFDNIVTVEAPNTPEITTDNNEDADNTVVSHPGIFDPPYGIKTVDASGLPVLEWGMVWINPEDLIDGVAYKARVVDPMPNGTTYVNGSLVCYFADLSTTNFSTTDRCEYDAATNSVIWEGSLGASGGDRNPDTAPNRLYIVFETTLQEGVEYAQNVATATYDADGDGDLGNNDNNEGVIVVSAQHGEPPAPTVLDPAIVKLVDPIFAQRGEIVTWTITVTNPHDTALDNVGFTDNMPSQFVITSTNATAGTVTVAGQVVRFTIGRLEARQSVTIEVVTRLADNVIPPFIVDNTAVLDGPYNGQSTATVTGVAELPATGETPQILDHMIFRFIREWALFINTIEPVE